MEKVVLRDVEIDNTSIEKLYIFLDDDGKISILPYLWLLHLSTTQSHYVWKINSEGLNSYKRTIKSENAQFVLENIYLSDNSIDNYIGHFFHFVKYINDLSKHKNSTKSIHNLESISDHEINYYLNEILSERLNSSAALHAHQAAITSFYCFLFYLEIRSTPVTRIYRKTRQKMAEQDFRVKKVSYISRDIRNSLLRLCSSKRDRLIIRLGHEVGLRASECCGLMLNDYQYRFDIRKGLLSLFNELSEKPNKMSFQFTLLGKYTKRGKTRFIYFDRELLEAIYDYYLSERYKTSVKSKKKTRTLFLRTDKAGCGLPISARHASNVFRKLLRKIKHANQTLSFHDLRHTFATELYHSELQSNDGRETRSESAALIVVAQRLGHKSPKRSTQLYLRLWDQMRSIERIRSQ